MDGFSKGALGLGHLVLPADAPALALALAPAKKPKPTSEGDVREAVCRVCA